MPSSGTQLAGMDFPQRGRNALCFQNQPTKWLSLASDSAAPVYTVLALLPVKDAIRWVLGTNGENKEGRG